MKTLYRILAVMLCVSIIQVSVPSVSFVSADDSEVHTSAVGYTTENIVSINDDTSTYESLDDAKDWILRDTTYGVWEISEDGYLQLRKVASKPLNDAGTAQNTSKDLYMERVLKGVIAQNEDNRTYVVSDRLDGKYKIDLSYEAVLDYVSPVPDTNIKLSDVRYELKLETVNTNNSDQLGCTSRIFGSSVTVLNHNSQNSSTIYRYENGEITTKRNLKINSLGLNSENNKGVFTYVVDTSKDVENNVKISSDGDSDGYVAGPLSVKGPLKGFELSGFQSMSTNSYFKIKKLEVTQIEAADNPDLDNMLALLPATLAPDVNNVTEDIIIPVVDGVTWTTSDENIITTSGKVNRIKTGSQEVVLTANFKINKINYSLNYHMTVAKADNKVIFKGEDGSVIKEYMIADGNTVESLVAADKEGYYFEYWYDEGNPDVAFDFSSPIYENKVLLPKYTPKTYTIKFMVEGELKYQKQGVHGSALGDEFPSVPEKDGFTSVGWVIGDSTVVFSKTTILDKDLVVNAVYIDDNLEKHTVSFMVDGVLFDSQEIYAGYTAVLPQSSPEKENYTFDYWMLNNTRYDFSTEVTSDLVLEAKFSPNEYKVTFYDEDRTTVLYNGKAYYNTAYGVLPESPTKDGTFVFDYWVTENNAKFTEQTVITNDVKVYAKYRSTLIVLVDEDLTKYTSLTDGFTKWIGTDNLCGALSVDNGIVLTQTKSTPTSGENTMNSAADNVLKATFEGVIEVDEFNKTVTKMHNFIGKYELEIDYASVINAPVYPEGYSGSRNTSFGVLYIGNNNVPGDLTTFANGPMSYRVFNSKVQAFNGKDEASNTIDHGNWPTVSGNIHTLHAVIDTPNNSITTWMDNGAAVTGNFFTAKDHFNSIRLSMQQRIGLGSYMKFTRVKITQLSIDEGNPEYKSCMETLDKLPDNLVSNPDAVTENFEIPKFENVTWSSSNESVINADGVVNRWYDDVDVVLTAHVLKGSYSYSKEYSLKVLRKTNVQNEVVYNKEYRTEEDLNNFEYYSLLGDNVCSYSVNGNGLKIEKVSPAENLIVQNENPVYYGFIDLYKNEKPYDEITKASVDSKDYQGTYDISLETFASVNSNVPLSISLGYRNNNKFYGVGSFKYTNDGLVFSYYQSPEIVQQVKISKNIETWNNLRIRINTNDKKMWIYSEGKLLTPLGISFSNPFSDQSFMFNALCVTLDKNSELGDYGIVKNISIKSLEKFDNPSVNSIIEAADSLTINAITDIPDELTGNIKNLPESILGKYSVKWKTNSDQIDMDTLEVFHNVDESTVVISALISDLSAKYPVVIKKDFTVKIRAAANLDEIAKYQLNKLGKITKQPYDDIRYDLTLPVAEGVNWASSRPDIISNDGKIVKSKLLTEDTNVTITAEKNGITKAYNVVVKKYSDLNTVYSNSSIPSNGITFELNGYKNIKFKSDVVSTITFVKNSEEGNIELVDKNNKKIVSLNIVDDGVSFDYDGSSKAIYSLTNGTENTVQFKFMPDVGRIAIWLNGNIVADYVEVLNNAEEFCGITTTNNSIAVKNVKVEADDYSLLQVNVDNIDYFSKFDVGYANSNINLVTDSVTDAIITWKSDNEDLISSTGEVDIPSVLTYATLTMKISDKENSDINLTFKKRIAVDCSAEKNIAKTAVVSGNSLENPSNPKKNVNDGHIDTIADILATKNGSKYIIYDFEKVVSFNTLYINETAPTIEKYSVEISTDGNSWQEIKSGDLSGINNTLITFNRVMSARYLKFVVDKCQAEKVSIRELKVYLFATASEMAEIDIELLDLNISSTKVDIELPEKGFNGTKFIWYSSHPEIISTTGKVVRPTKNTTVTLKVSAEGTNKTKEFSIYVEGTSGSTGPQVIPSGGAGGSGGGSGGGTSGGASGGTIINSVEDGAMFIGDEDVKQETIQTTSYYDVTEDAWFYEYVNALTEKGIVSGDGTGNFNPNGLVTREQFVKMVVLASGIELSENKNAFKDADSNAWYVPYIMAAKENGVVQGIDESNFGIGTNISRQDMAVVIERILESNGYKPEPSSEQFADDNLMSSYAKNAIYSIKSLGIINGYNGMFNPKEALTRAEASKVIYSLIDFLEKLDVDSKN